MCIVYQNRVYESSGVHSIVRAFTFTLFAVMPRWQASILSRKNMDSFLRRNDRSFYQANFVKVLIVSFAAVIPRKVLGADRGG